MDSGAPSVRVIIVVVDALEVSVEGDLHRELAEQLAEPLRAVHEQRLATAYEWLERQFAWSESRYLERRPEASEALGFGSSHGYDRALLEQKLRQVQLAVDLARPRQRGSELRS